MIEVWKDIDGYVGLYQVSNLGRVRSLDREVIYKDGRKVLRKGRLIKQQLNTSGYSCFRIWREGAGRTVTTHRLVGLAFLKKIPGKEFINHIDGIRTNCRVDNLEWCTPKENSEHACKVLKSRPSTFGVKNPNVRLTEEQVLKIRKLLKEGLSCNKLGERYKVTPANISRIKRRITWKNL